MNGECSASRSLRSAPWMRDRTRRRDGTGVDMVPSSGKVRPVAYLDARYVSSRTLSRGGVMAPSELPHPGADDLEVGPILLALADENRRRVIAELAAQPDEERLCASFDLPVSKSSRTHHWRVLREAGLVQQRDAGNRLYMRLRKKDLDRRFPGLIEAVVTADRHTR